MASMLPRSPGRFPPPPPLGGWPDPARAVPTCFLSGFTKQLAAKEFKFQERASPMPCVHRSRETPCVLSCSGAQASTGRTPLNTVLRSLPCGELSEAPLQPPGIHPRFHGGRRTRPTKPKGSCSPGNRDGRPHSSALRVWERGRGQTLHCPSQHTRGKHIWCTHASIHIPLTHASTPTQTNAVPTHNQPHTTQPDTVICISTHAP